jgi:Zn-dependent protease with chaperone function
MSPGPAEPGPAALYFDGRSARPRPVRLGVNVGFLVAIPLADPDGDADANGALDMPLRWPLEQVRWPERTRHGQRLLHLADGAQLQVADAAAFDRWRAQRGPREGWVVRAQQHWRSTIVALMLLVAVGVAAYQWGVPVAARGIVALLPPAADAAVGAQALEAVRAQWLRPSRLPPARQAELRQAFADMVAKAWPAGGAPEYRLHFHASKPALGPNALALPGGDIVVTDALVELLQGQDDAVLGVMAHELGHVQHRHGMRALAQFALLSTATGVALGDFSSLLAALPAWMGQMGYSRDAERQADAVAARLLRVSGRSPAVMVLLFERLAEHAPERTGPPIALASHPADAERKRFFSDPAAGAGPAD